MSKAVKYDALQLADDLVKWPYERYEAAAELRRLVAENETLREANEAFGKRQEWWNDKMVALEAINAELREALKAEREACAKVCESEGKRIDASWMSCAAAIRSRT